MMMTPEQQAVHDAQIHLDMDALLKFAGCAQEGKR